MHRFKMIGHTADVRLFVEGSTIEELFLGALKGMAKLISPLSLNKKTHIETEIKVSATNETFLLIDFLQEALTLSHITSTLFTEVIFKTLTENSLVATLSGIKLDSFRSDVKAVTYHEALIKKREDGIFEAQIIFDI